MKSLNSTRVKAPDKSNQPLQPTDLLRTAYYEASPPKPIRKHDDVPTAGAAPCRKPIGRDGADTPEGRKALLTTKKVVGIGTWNVRTLHQPGNLEILLSQLNKFKWEIVGISETHWTDSGEFTSEGFKILCA